MNPLSVPCPPPSHVPGGGCGSPAGEPCHSLRHRDARKTTPHPARRRAATLARTMADEPRGAPPTTSSEARRAAPIVKVCPSSVEQRRAWQGAADRAGLSLSAWLARAGDAALLLMHADAVGDAPHIHFVGISKETECGRTSAVDEPRTFDITKVTCEFCHQRKKSSEGP